MAETGSSKNDASDTTGSNRPFDRSGSASRQKLFIDALKEKPLEALLFVLRSVTAVFCVMFVVLQRDNQSSHYAKALLASAATNIVRLYQRLGPIQISRDFFARLFIEDSCHYLFYSLLFLGMQPITMALVPILLYAILHWSSFAIHLLNLYTYNSPQWLLCYADPHNLELRIYRLIFPNPRSCFSDQKVFERQIQAENEKIDSHLGEIRTNEKISLRISGWNGNAVWHFLNNLVSGHSQQLLLLISCCEVFLFPMIVVMIFLCLTDLLAFHSLNLSCLALSGKCSIVMPFVYYRFLSLRYSSRRNPSTRTVFYQMRMAVEQTTASPVCPMFVRNAVQQLLGLIGRLAPTVAA